MIGVFNGKVFLKFFSCEKLVENGLFRLKYAIWFSVQFLGTLIVKKNNTLFVTFIK
jgi:hypothetical protein